MMQSGVVPVVTGFVGATEKGVPTTLGRGGSDYSAAILGAALDADEIQIWTDVDGVMTADPRIVENAQSMEELSYEEVAELAYYGAKVLHPKTVTPAVESSIPLRVLNTFNPSHPGTRIVEKTRQLHHGVKAITAVRALRLITVAGRGMIGVPGIAARTFDAVARQRANVLMISQGSSEQSICFVVPGGGGRCGGRGAQGGVRTRAGPEYDRGDQPPAGYRDRGGDRRGHEGDAGHRGAGLQCAGRTEYQRDRDCAGVERGKYQPRGPANGGR